MRAYARQWLTISVFIAISNAWAPSPAFAQAREGDEGSGSITVPAPGSGRGSWRDDLRVSFFNFSTAPTNQVAESAARVKAYNYFAFDYRFARGRKVSLRPVFEWTTAGTDARDVYAPGSLWLGDGYVSYVDRALPRFWGDVEFAMQLRYYVPSSAASQAKGMIGRVRPEFKFSKWLGRGFSLELTLEPDYFIQGRTASVNEKGKILTNNHYGYESSLELQYQVNRQVGLAAAIGHNEGWSHVSPINGIVTPFRKEDMTVQAGVSAALGPVFVVGGLSQVHGVMKPQRDFSLFHSAETDVFLLNNWSF